MTPNLSSTNWGGLFLIIICVVAATIATSAIILGQQQAQLYNNAPYHLEGGQAFSTFAFTNLLFLFAGVSSIIASFIYLIILFLPSIRSSLTRHLILSGLFLIPCIYRIVLH